MTDRELMQQALEALESLHQTGDTQVFDMFDAPVLIPALRERLAQPEQEPVAWKETDEVECPVCNDKGFPWPKCGHITYLERTPPQRTHMNREDIIRMAEDCGIPEFQNYESQAANIMRFAALVAAHEREACAKLLDEMAARDKLSNYYAVAANAIRAKGNQ